MESTKIDFVLESVQEAESEAVAAKINVGAWGATPSKKAPKSGKSESTAKSGKTGKAGKRHG
jgi:hypothetical protein